MKDYLLILEKFLIKARCFLIKAALHRVTFLHDDDIFFDLSASTSTKAQSTHATTTRTLLLQTRLNNVSL